MDRSRLALGTRAAHAGIGTSTSAVGPHTFPIFQTSNFTYPDAATADRAAAGETYLYSRHGNPTVEAFESALADLEGADGAVAFGSGMAALAAALFTLPPGRLLLSEGLYGGTAELLRTGAGRHGFTVDLVPAWDTQAVARALTPDTRGLVVETLSNPLLRVCDLPALASLCQGVGAALVVDSSAATPVLCRPLAHGASLVVHSATKFLGGHGDLLGGVVLGRAETLAPLRAHRILHGAVLEPFSAWLALRGLRTLPVRLERQCETAARLASILVGLPGVRAVHHPSLPAHPDHARARALLAAGGALVSFELADLSAARAFYDRVRLIGRAASFGEVSSLLTHPATFSHKALPPAERARQGIADGLLRLSVGLEDVQDLERDVRQALQG